MKLPRFSVASLMGWVVVVAVVVGALKYPTPLGTDALRVALFVSLMTAIVGGMVSRGPARPGWIGFAVFGGAYALLSFHIKPESYGLSIGPPHATQNLLLLGRRLIMPDTPGIGPDIGTRLRSMTSVDPADAKSFFDSGHAMFGLAAGCLGARVGRLVASRNPTS
jgi:hypothetical protein